MKLSKTEIRNELWRRGELRFLFKERPAQLAVYDYLQLRKERDVVAALHRRLGKSYLAFGMSVEKCLRKPQTVVVYAGPAIKQIYGILKPIERQILATCPPELRPKFNQGLDCYEFANGSLIWIAAADLNRADASRGKSCDFAVFDEEGFATDPDYLIQSVLMPALLHSNGTLLHISTPPKTPSHAFARRMREFEGKPNFFRYTVLENPMASEKFIEECAQQSGGRQSTLFRREYLCEVITEEKDAVIPEMGKNFSKLVSYSQEFGPIVVAASINFAGLSVLCAMHKSVDFVETVDEIALPNANAGDIERAAVVLFERHQVAIRDRTIFTNLEDDAIAALNSKAVVPFAKTFGFEQSSSLAILRHLIERGAFSAEKTPTILRHLSDAIYTKGRNAYESSGDHGNFDGIMGVLVGLQIVAEPKIPLVLYDSHRYLFKKRGWNLG